MITFNSQTKNLLVQRGKIEDLAARKFIRGAVGLIGKKVEATKHTILSGPPGVGKTHGTLDECNKGQVNSIMIPPGISDIDLTVALASAVYKLTPGQELVVILDDADDVVFGSYEKLNKWKIAMGDVNYTTGAIPYYSHAVSMTGTLTSLEKQGRHELIEALNAFQADGRLGIMIPMDRVRFIVLCNKDLENPKTFSRQAALKSAIDAVMDRFKYKRMNLDWETQWGWLAYVLSQSQPFDAYPLSDDQKKELLDWMYSNWDKLRGTSYRTVRKLAASMINNPTDFEDEWQEELRGN